ncbi:hypothetical protein [Shewanella sp. MBTL60-007]|uniref:hypothetical protein n=1 Tax=Shewanella sp. MBTL60-007 TaxID=2815911 RepID=UPI001BC7B871|nr:hypothetical protein [Shewanella sp. MBTL60-007]GIU30562.1 hypothetical protein TUM3792_41470 [Shewanella sp. MBTL60-007]
MTLSPTLFFIAVLPFMIIIGALSYYLGKRKTNTPIITTTLGTISGVCPPLGLIYLMLLTLKNDIEK